MKFYKTTFLTDEIGSNGKYKPGKPVWCTSASDASACRSAKKKEFKSADPTTVEVDIEPTKAGLLAFLNGPDSH